MFRSGQRVSLLWRVFEHFQDRTDEISVRFNATVIAENGLRFIVRVDDMDDLEEGIPAKHVFRNESLIIKVKPSDLAQIDEPARVLCSECCAYEGEADRCLGYGDPKSWDSYWPSQCLKRQVPNP